jgi:hypothetical protein
MTNQHQATPDEWAQQEDWANRSVFSDSSCIIELRDRIEAMEATQQPLVNYAPAKPEQWEQRAALIERLSRLEEGYDELLVRIEALEATQQPREFTGQVVAPITNQTGPGVGAAPTRPGPESAPTISLVDRLAVALLNTTRNSNADTKARTVILEVAAALLDWWYSDEVARTGWEAAKWLEQEANR